jgi:hypothetical protein
MGREVAVARRVDAWWSGYVPEVVVDAFDACATTGVGPDATLAHRAYAILAARLEAVAAAGPAADGGPSAADLVGDPTLGLHLFVRERMGWAVPDGTSLDAIARDHAGERVVELGCGSGYVAACLRARGLDVVAVAAPDHLCRWERWWPRRYVADPVRALASALAYDAATYLMLMPDRDGAGEDMMAEALGRMPVGATLYLHAPEHCSGSRAGHALLASRFAEGGRLPMLDTVPTDGPDARDGLVRYVKLPGTGARAVAAPARAPRSPWARVAG